MANVGRRSDTAKNAANSTTPSLTLPSTWQAGDTMILWLAWDNTSTPTLTDPSGWTVVGSNITAGGVTARLFQRTARSTDPGASVSATLSAGRQWAMGVIAYTEAVYPVSVTTATDGSNTTSHAAPALSAPASTSWALNLYAEVSTTNASWTKSASDTAVVTQLGSGTLAASILMADSNATTGGTWGSQTATSGTSTRAAMASIEMAVVSTDTTWFLNNTQTDHSGNTFNLVPTAIAASNTSTTCNFGTTTGQGTMRLIPFAANSTRESIATSLTDGWRIPRFAVMGSEADAKRIFPAGDWNFLIKVKQSSAVSTTVTITVIVERISADAATATEIFRIASAGQSVGSISVVTFTWSALAQAAVVLEPNETIQFTYWITGNGVAVTGNTYTFTIDNVSQFNHSIGLRTQYIRTPSSETTSGTDSGSRLYTGARSSADTVAGTDTVARAYLGARSLSDTVTALNAATRVFTGFRSSSDTVTAADTASRIALHPRAISDTVAATDTTTRSFTGSRAVSDTVTGSDTANQNALHVRAVSDTVTASDATTRRFTGARSVFDTVAATDSVTRRFTGSRAISDTVAGTDAATRTTQVFRSMFDTVTATDSTGRVVIFRRNESDTVTASDAVTRGFTGSRLITDSVTGTDSVFRAIIYGRTMSEYPPGVTPDWPIVFPTKSITGTVTDGGVPVVGITVYLFRTFDDKAVQTTVTDGSGVYTFVRDLFDPYTYYTATWETGPDKQTVSPRDLLPS